MANCYNCGGEIVIRYVDGAPTPIHLSGERCPGYGRSAGYGGSRYSASERPFATVESYANPNAMCPVCGDKVYFYQSPYGGRVFFNDLGWPWDKHGCTDNERAQTEPVQTIKRGSRSAFQTREGRALEIFELADSEETGEAINFKFRQIGKLVTFFWSCAEAKLDAAGITLKDIQHAPSFVVETYGGHRLLRFISIRHGRIVSLKIRRNRR